MSMAVSIANVIFLFLSPFIYFFAKHAEKSEKFGKKRKGLLNEKNLQLMAVILTILMVALLIVDMIYVMFTEKIYIG